MNADSWDLTIKLVVASCSIVVTLGGAIIGAVWKLGRDFGANSATTQESLSRHSREIQILVRRSLKHDRLHGEHAVDHEKSRIRDGRAEKRLTDHDAEFEEIRKHIAKTGIAPA